MSKIQWTDMTWNCLVGCSIPSIVVNGKRRARAGCANCYACKDSPHRFAETYDREGVVVLRGSATREGLTYVPRSPSGKSLGKGAQWTGEVRLLPWALDVPLRRRKPTRYFVNSLSDVFHESVVGCEEGRRFVAAMFGVMAAAPQHTFQILTKRPDKAREWFAWVASEACQHMAGIFESSIIEHCIYAANDHLHAARSRDAAETLLTRWLWATQGEYAFEAMDGAGARRIGRLVERLRGDPAAQIDEDSWPLPNVWIGTSVEDQDSADWAIPHLLEVPAAVRFLSCEPLLGRVDIAAPVLAFNAAQDRSEFVEPTWVIVGGESGPKSRSCEVGWIRSIVKQCKAAEVPVFVKQLGSRPLARSEDDLGPEAHAAWDADNAGSPFTLEGWLPKLRSSKGGDPEEWPEDLRVREMPG